MFRGRIIYKILTNMIAPIIRDRPFESFNPRVRPDSEASSWFTPFIDTFIEVEGTVIDVRLVELTSRKVEYVTFEDLKLISHYPNNSIYKKASPIDHPILKGQYHFRLPHKGFKSFKSKPVSLQLLVCRKYKDKPLCVFHDTVTCPNFQVLTKCLQKLLITLDSVEWAEDQIMEKIKEFHVMAHYCIQAPFVLEGRVKMTRIYDREMFNFISDKIDAFVGNFVVAFTRGDLWNETSVGSVPHFIKAIMDISDQEIGELFYEGLRTNTIDRNRVWLRTPFIITDSSDDALAQWTKLGDAIADAEAD